MNLIFSAHFNVLLFIAIPLFIFVSGASMAANVQRSQSYLIIFNYYLLVCDDGSASSSLDNIDCERFGACNTIYSDVIDAVSCYNKGK